MENKLSQDLTAAAITNINTAIATIKTNLPFLLTLTAEERSSLAKMGNKSLAFVRKSYEYAKLNPTLVPTFVVVDELRKDLETVDKLHAIYAQITDLQSRLDDTIMLASSEAYMAALTFYSSVQMASKNNVPGAKSILEDLSERFSYKKAKIETKKESNN
jgi:hypothetical protein